MAVVEPSGREYVLSEADIISTRTDERGVITFANPAFIRITGFSKEELIGRPHNMIRHPDVPRAVYFVLWEHIKKDRERFFAVTKNVCKSGDHYWTIGYFQPELSKDGEITGYRSTRHGLHDEKLKAEFDQLYRQVREEELKHPRPQQVEAGMEALTKALARKGFKDYETYAKRAL
jgi:PAS domain S-box-containing protein